jgi:polyisoprenoid-binding protein YceI
MSAGLMNRRLRLVPVISAALLVTGLVSASARAPVVKESAVKFEAAAPAGLKINGESSGVKASEAAGKIKLTAPTTEFHTGIGLRDKHLREAIEADKHPDATLVFDKSAIKLPESGSANGTTSGALTFHGVTKTAPFNYTITKKGDAYQVHAEFSVTLTDYQVKKPCYLGVCVGDMVKIAADLTILAS